METLYCDEVWIRQDRARRQLGFNHLLNSQSLFSLSQETIDFNRVSLPFQVRVNIVDEIKIKGRRYTGLLLHFPFALYHILPNMRPRILADPPYGVLICVSRAELDNPNPGTQGKLDRILEGRNVDPQIALANLIFLHEWRHFKEVVDEGVILNKRTSRRREAICETFAEQTLSQMVSRRNSLVIASLG